MYYNDIEIWVSENKYFIRETLLEGMFKLSTRFSLLLCVVFTCMKTVKNQRREKKAKAFRKELLRSFILLHILLLSMSNRKQSL